MWAEIHGETLTSRNRLRADEKLLSAARLIFVGLARKDGLGLRRRLAFRVWIRPITSYLYREKPTLSPLLSSTFR